MQINVDHQEIIQKNYVFLKESIEPKPLADFLLNNQKISPMQHEPFLKYQRMEAADECLRILKVSRPAFDSFIKFLKSDISRKHILDRLLSDMAEEIRLVIVGKTGVGKSALGNNILDGDVFYSKAGSQSVTKDYKRGERMIDEDNKIVLVDTPGLFDTRNNDNMETAKILTSTVKVTKPGPHVFIFVLSINSRFTAEEKAAIEFLKDLFGTSLKDYLIIVFTGKDSLIHDNKDFETYIDEAGDDLKLLLRQCQGRVAINNRASRKEVTRSVDDILKLIKRVYRQNDKKCYTDEMLTEAEEKFEEKLRLQKREGRKRERELEEENYNKLQENGKLKNVIAELNEEKIRSHKNDEEKIKTLEQEKEEIKKYYESAIKRNIELEEEVKILEQEKNDYKNRIEILRKHEKEAHKKYEDEKKEKEKLRLQAEEAHRRERELEEEVNKLEQENTELKL